MNISAIQGEFSTLQNTRLAQLALSDSGFVFDPNTGQSFSVNQSGLWLLRQFKQCEQLTQIVSLMIEQYALTEHAAQHSLSTFIQQLRRYFA